MIINEKESTDTYARRTSTTGNVKLDRLSYI